MVTRKTIISKTSQFIVELRNEGIDPLRVFLFGSYAKGTCNDHSDIDIAIWAKGFSGIRSLDIEIISHLLKKYKPFEMHTFSEVLDLDDPYQQEIILSGIDLANEIPITA